MNKLLLIISAIYLAIIFGLSFCWQNLPLNSTQKGDDIISCVGLIGLLTLIYSVISKLVVGKALLIAPMIITPLVSLGISILILIIGNAILGGMTDYLNLQIYFYLNGVTSVAYVFLVTKYSVRHNSL